MARRISVHSATPNGVTILEFIKRSVAQCRLRQNLAAPIFNELGKLIAIKMLPVRERPALNKPYDPHRKLPPYIPEHLPPAELPGIRFEPPASALILFPDKVFPDYPQLEL